MERLEISFAEEHREIPIGEKVYPVYYCLNGDFIMICADSLKYNFRVCYRFKQGSETELISATHRVVQAVALIELATSGKDLRLSLREIDGKLYITTHILTPERCFKLGDVYSDGECFISIDRFLEAVVRAMFMS